MTSRPAIKAYLSTILFLTTSTILLTLSSTAYAFFYHNYIPQFNLERVLYLQYDSSDQTLQHPYAMVALDNNALTSQQAYDVSLIIDMPRCATNLDAGNFMLDLSLLSPKAVPDTLSSWLGNTTLHDVLHRSRRPAIMPYTSPILSLSHTLLHLPWHLLNMRDLDRSKLVIPMFEMLELPRGSRNIPTHARLEIQASSILRIYDVKLLFEAKFQGMRYLLYNYRVVSFLVFTMLFYAVSVGSLVLGWVVVSRAFATRDEGRGMVKQESEGTSGFKSERGEMEIKMEDYTESSVHGGLSVSNISETPAQYPSGGGRAPLSYAGRTSGSTVEAEAKTGEGEGEEDRLTRPMGAGEAADDEDEGDMLEEEQELRGRAFDSGIGTSMESEHAGLGVRRRSSRGSAKK